MSFAENFRERTSMNKKRAPHARETKALSAKKLLDVTRKVFDTISRDLKRAEISLSDCLMSALAMFGMKSPSLLAFDGPKLEEPVQHNLKTLYKVDRVPSDTRMREVLDKVDPREIRNAYLSVFHEVQRGKLLERYRFLDGYLCLVDGSEVFNSEKIHCKNCCRKEHKDGRVTYHHQILGAVLAHPENRQVIPLCPEPIMKQDGATKNDCEQNAFRRLLQDLKREHPRLKLTICSDALSATAPHVNNLKANGYNCLIVVKPEGNRSLFEFVKNAKEEVKMTVGTNRYTFRYVNDVPLNETQDAPQVNFFECEWVEVVGRKEREGRGSWITLHEITDDNLYTLMRGGRCRWKIENETFNTLKNQGYQFEHNFGHGKQNLHTVFVLLMMLAFLIDQVQEAACGLFQQGLAHRKTRRAFWEKMRALFYNFFIDSWLDMFRAIGPSFKGGTVVWDTS
jgi:hypothetical protein